MLRRAVTLITALAFAVMTAMTAAHAATLVAGDSHTDHAVHVMAAADAHGSDCGTDGACDLGGADRCAAVCAGLLSYLSTPLAAGSADHIPTRHEAPVEISAHGHVPALNEPPPRRRFL